MNLEEVAKLLHRSEDTIYAYTHRKQIPHSKIIGSLIFSKKEILEWVRTNKVKTLDEIDIDADNYLSKKNRKKSLK